jgi:hypothetical protein
MKKSRNFCPEVNRKVYGGIINSAKLAGLAEINLTVDWSGILALSSVVLVGIFTCCSLVELTIKVVS